MAMLRRQQEAEPGSALTSHRVGNALVVHPAAGMSGPAQAMALAVAEDLEHDLVVIDIPVGTPISTWDEVAAELPRRRRGVRLVIWGRPREATGMVGQWLAERLNRTVIAPDGAVILGARGALLVHSEPGTGWLRFHPGRSPQRDSKRFPRPSWDVEAAGEVFQTSARGIAEPLPAGLWVHPTGIEPQLRSHRTNLIERLPMQPDVLTVVLGTPGGPALSADDAARTWLRFPAEAQRRTRFVQFGPVASPRELPLGQALADLVGRPVSFYTGVPIENDFGLDVRAVLPDGSLGFRPFTRELTYHPAGSEDDLAPDPQLLDHRAPLPGLPMAEEGAYLYAPDAVVEVVPSGLLVRPLSGAEQSGAVRAIAPDPLVNHVVYEDATPSLAARMGALAEDVLGSLDEGTRAASRLVPAATLIAEHRMAPGQGDVRAAGIAAASVEERSGRRSPVAPPIGSERPVELGPAVAGSITLGADVLLPGSMPGGATGAEPQPALAESGSQPEVTPGTETALLPMVSVVGSPTTPAGAGEPRSSGQPAAATGGAAGDDTGRHARSERPDPAFTLTAEPPRPTVTAAPETVAVPVVPARGAAPEVGEPAMAAPPRGVRPGSGGPTPPAAGTSAPSTPAQASVGAAPAPVRMQPAPAPEASALLPARGLDREREWLRKSLGQDFGTRANAVARVLSQHPGYQGELARSSGELITDAVAVQLYLSPAGAAVDPALRAARVGPHVPLARAVVAGLNRLPSHRGPTAFSASTSRQQWALYRERSLHTEWAFLHTIGRPAGRDDDTDVLVWSMTGRRTRLLEPEDDAVADRVLFVPGTSFKVLELAEPREGVRGRILIRELAAAEIDADGQVDPDRVSLDEIALTALRQEVERWPQSDPPTSLPAAAAARFGALPGLI
jgi:hypothetical protein